jgi:FkbM family methyltransferase
LKDPYYNRLIYPKFKYEPEIEFILKKLKKLNYLFVDVGANFGYWSLLVSSKEFNKKKVIAIEPLRSNFNFLKKNLLDNNNRFEILNIGAGEKKKYSKIFFSGKLSNAGASINKNSETDLINSEIIKLDTIDNILLKKKDKRFVIKLDVEGNEIKALNGARNTLKKDCLIIYEDHGKDKFHLNSKYFLKKNYSIFSFDGKKIHQIKKINELNNIKKIKHKGYNFIATRSLFFKRNLY